MTDEELLWKKLAFIDTCVHELRTLAKPEALPGDVRERRFVEHTLQLAIQAALDVAAHIVSAESLGEPVTNKDLFDRLVGAGWVDAALAAPLRNMAGFRNVLVHGYAEVDVGIVRDVLANHLGDLTTYAAAVRARLRPGA